MEYKIGGFRSDDNANQYEAFDVNTHIKSGFLLPGESDLRAFSVKRHNQISTSTCVAQSLTKCLEVKRAIKYGIDKHVDLSVLSVYFGARSIMDPPETNLDEGTLVSLAAESIKRFGVCRDVMHPFKLENLYIPPNVLADREEYLNKIDGHLRIASDGEDRINDICANLSVNNPVVAGFQIGDELFNYGVNSPPIGITKNPKGWHAMAILGFIGGLFVLENSWGNSFGQNGFLFVKPELVADPNQMKDPWVILDGTENWFEKR